MHLCKTPDPSPSRSPRSPAHDIAEIEVDAYALAVSKSLYKIARTKQNYAHSK